MPNRPATCPSVITIMTSQIRAATKSTLPCTLDTMNYQGFMKNSQVVNFQTSKALQSYQIATQEQCRCVVSVVHLTIKVKYLTMALSRTHSTMLPS